MSSRSSRSIVNARESKPASSRAKVAVAEPVQASQSFSVAQPAVKKPRAPRAKKEAAVVQVEPVVEPVIEPITSEEASESVPVSTRRVKPSKEEILSNFDSIMSSLSSYMNEAKERKETVPKVMKEQLKSLKSLRSMTSKSIKNSKSTVPKEKSVGYGFSKPTVISEELSSFIGTTPGELVSRTFVTKTINDYVNEHKLRNENNRVQILPDAALASLLDYKGDDVLTIATLQRYLKPHYPKKA